MSLFPLSLQAELDLHKRATRVLAGAVLVLMVIVTALAVVLCQANEKLSECQASLATVAPAVAPVLSEVPDGQ